MCFSCTKIRGVFLMHNFCFILLRLRLLQRQVRSIHNNFSSCLICLYDLKQVSDKNLFFLKTPNLTPGGVFLRVQSPIDYICKLSNLIPAYLILANIYFTEKFFTCKFWRNRDVHHDSPYLGFNVFVFFWKIYFIICENICQSLYTFTK